jgi:hypothetical protein
LFNRKLTTGPRDELDVDEFPALRVKESMEFLHSIDSHDFLPGISTPSCSIRFASIEISYASIEHCITLNGPER